MRQRQIGQHPIVRAHREQLTGDVGDEREIRVAEHHSLWRTGGAGGVDERGQSARLERGRPLLDARLGSGLGEREKILPAEQARVARRALARHQHHAPESVERSKRRLQPLPLRAALEQQERRLGVADDIGHLGGRRGGVDAGRGAARRHAGDVEDGPLRAVEAEHAGRLLRLEPEREQRPRRLAHQPRIVAKRRRHPRAAGAHVIRGSLRVRARQLRQPRWYRVCHQGILHARAGPRIHLLPAQSIRVGDAT